MQYQIYKVTIASTIEEGQGTRLNTYSMQNSKPVFKKKNVFNATLQYVHEYHSFIFPTVGCR
jgi:hypothetical protein